MTQPLARWARPCPTPSGVETSNSTRRKRAARRERCPRDQGGAGEAQRIARGLRGRAIEPSRVSCSIPSSLRPGLPVPTHNRIPSRRWTSRPHRARSRRPRLPVRVLRNTCSAWLVPGWSKSVVPEEWSDCESRLSCRAPDEWRRSHSSSLHLRRRRRPPLDAKEWTSGEASSRRRHTELPIRTRRPGGCTAQPRARGSPPPRDGDQCRRRSTAEASLSTGRERVVRATSCRTLTDRRASPLPFG